MDTKELFISANAKNFSLRHLAKVKNILDEADEIKLLYLQGTSFKSPTLVLTLSLLFGSLGIDRFIIGETKLGVLKLITGIGFIFNYSNMFSRNHVGIILILIPLILAIICIIWTMYDIFTAIERTKDSNWQKFITAVS
ncbi:hypothetical protein EZS27_035240 [termite gut metagenome]|uniref:TM2 domain-containing protein n=1 Tax=termite gut metagenome TaxID=433724 RepID=A0A5J4PZI6_9ZZZZ